MGSTTSATRIGPDAGGWKLSARVYSTVVEAPGLNAPGGGRGRREHCLPGDLCHQSRTPLAEPAAAVDVLERRREYGSRQIYPAPHRVAAKTDDASGLFADSPVPHGAVAMGARRSCGRPGVGPGLSEAARTAATCHGRAECEERPAESRVSFAEFRLFKERGQLTRL